MAVDKAMKSNKKKDPIIDDVYWTEHGITCSMDVVVDIYWVEKVGWKNGQIIRNYIKHIVDTTNRIFRNHMFNGTIITFELKEVIVLDSYVKMHNYFGLDEYLYSTSQGWYLNLFAKHEQSKCVNILVTGIEFWTQQVSPVTAVIKLNEKTGACANQPNENGRRMNVGMVGLKAVLAYDRTKLVQSAMQMAKALGHLLGAFNDPSDGPFCGGIQSIMTEIPTKLYMPKMASFSDCSRRRIDKQVADHNFGCMSPIQSVCDNGILEPWEVCDCGDADFCKLVTSCCMPGKCNRASASTCSEYDIKDWY